MAIGNLKRKIKNRNEKLKNVFKHPKELHSLLAGEGFNLRRDNSNLFLYGDCLFGIHH